MKVKLRLFFACCWLLFLSACISHKPFYNKNLQLNSVQNLPAQKPAHIVYLLGDAGLPDIASDPEKKDLHWFVNQQLVNEKQKQTLIFLGDNIYPAGLPDSNSSYRKKAEDILLWQLKMAQNSNAGIVFVPGNHDWNMSQKGGLQAVIRQQKFLEAQNNKNLLYLPGNGCPGPEILQLNKKLLLVVLDSEWWLHKYEKPGENSTCHAKNQNAIIHQLDSVLQKNPNKNIIVAAHHPPYTMGTHGGYFPLRDHFFPLHVLKNNLYIPLPILGSIYVGYRKYIGHTQDAPGAAYTKYRLRVDSVLQRYSNVVMVSGHDHNLQFLKRNGKTYLVSGSGSKVDYVKRGGNAEFTQSATGFMRLLYYNNGDVYLEIYSQQKKDELPQLRLVQKING